MTAHWRSLADAADAARQHSGQLWIDSLAARCPFVLSLGDTGKPLGYSDAFRCERDVHDGGDHHLSDAAWVKSERTI